MRGTNLLVDTKYYIFNCKYEVRPTKDSNKIKPFVSFV